MTTLEHLSNPLVTSQQLQALNSSDGPDTQATRFYQCHLTQAAGILLRLPQEVIATAIVLLQRYLVSASASTNQTNDQPPPSPRLLSAAALYLTAKISFTPLTPRSVINVYTYLINPASTPLWYINPSATTPANDPPPDPQTYYVSEGRYASERNALFNAEATLLSGLAFTTHVVLPHQLALTYLQTLLPSSSSSSSTTPKLATRVFSLLNDALLSPQLLYLTHQPNALAAAAIYLAARDVGVKLVELNWWEVFDVEREDLGFLVLGLGSVAGFVAAEKERMEEAASNVTGIDLG